MVVFDHVSDLKVFYHDRMIAFSIGLRRLEMVISTLTSDLEVCLGDMLSRFTASMTAFLASAHCALFASECSLRCAIETRVLNAIAIAIGEKGLEPNINANSGMRTCRWCMLGVWFSLTDDQGIPMPISPRDAQRDESKQAVRKRGQTKEGKPL